MTTHNRKVDFLKQALPGIAQMRPYSPGKPVSELARELGLDDIIKLASNENPLGCGELATAAVVSGLDELEMYPDGNGFELKKALSMQHQVASDRITLGNGSNDVLELLARTFVQAGDEVIFSEYAFAVYSLVTQAVGGVSKIAPAKNFGHDLEAMHDLLSAKTKLIFIANPNNPTGTWLASGELKRFLNRVPSQVLVVVDEAYFEYVLESDYPDTAGWISDYPNLVVTRTFSKAHGLASLRMGYSLSHPDVADLMNRIRQPFNVNGLAQLAAAAALGDQTHLQESVKVNQHGLKELEHLCKKMGIGYIPSVGNFLAVDVGKSGNEVFQQLLQEGIIVRPLAEYGMPNYVRITIGTPQQIERVIFALKKVLHK